MSNVPTTEPDPTHGVAPVVVIIGAGPAGLTAAYQLAKAGVRSTVLESDTVVGGISRTVERDGWRFDIGGHRFFTKVRAVDDLWFEILGADEFLQRPRMSRIFYQGKLYDYPLSPMNALRNLGPIEAVRCVASYLWVRVRPPKDQSHIEGFVAARFGWRLYRTFFKTYTEKVWGIPATELSADWGAQRIKNLSLFRAVAEALKPKSLRRRTTKGKQVTSLIEEFNYPKYGPGQMWEKAAQHVVAAGSTLEFERTVVQIDHADGRAYEVVAVDPSGQRHRYPCTHVISTMPMGALLHAMEPGVDENTSTAAKRLTYRDFLTVALVVPAEFSFPDNWIYIHDPGVQVGRIQNFGSWSPYLVKEGRTCLGLEYFVNEGDGTWTMPDDELVALGTRELARLGLVAADKVEAGYVVRMPKAYPVYDDEYQDNVDALRSWIATNTPNVHPVGRNGMHKYNNQDHSMLTAMLAVENILGADHDVWSVNVEAEYHEESVDRRDGGNTTGRDAPVLPRTAIEAAAAERARRS
ncbi:MAG TPA: NAD(P)/FAD-dependent oxidoreductase [Acidimicrobiia bacterium]|nr:NAD(P)/FAD-dependent oxidoreductase [Acidimicrobiia bacterium]